jgi:ATP-dependent Clp protease ATP-binding subunit ClpX
MEGVFMSDSNDSKDEQKDLLEAMKKMMAQVLPEKEASTAPEKEVPQDPKKKIRERILNFQKKPREIKKHLDRFVIQQDEAKKVLATAVCDHYNYVRMSEKGDGGTHYIKQNILMLGPTGVGKTYLIKCLADLIGVPFVKADATKFSETGYVGGDVEDLVRDLVQKADGDIALAQYGIVYIDEIDKIANHSSDSGMRDVTGGGVQRGLLKIMEETEVPLRAGHDIQSQMQSMFEFQKKGKVTKPTINTKHILFIVSGAFGELGAMIDKRIRTSTIGFANKNHEIANASHLFRLSRTQDFIKYGFEPEFIGRLPVRVVCDPLSVDDLFHILKDSEGSVLEQYQLSFSAYKIILQYETKALKRIAELAHEEETGARGLITVFERTFRYFKYELPSTSISSLLLNEKMVENPNEVLEAYLQKDLEQAGESLKEQLKQFSAQFFDEHQIKLIFADAALPSIYQEWKKSNDELPVFLKNLFAEYPYGLGLLKEKKGQDEFMIDEKVILNPKETLDAWVKGSYE